MDVPLELAFHNMEPSEAIEQKARARVERLHRYFSPINSVRVGIEVPHRSQAHALTYHVRIQVGVPGKELVVSRDPGDHNLHFDPLLAIRDSFDAMERQLEAHARKSRGEVKRHEPRLQGHIRRLVHDHGFIATNDGREIYFHRNAVIGKDFDQLETGAPVELEVAYGESPEGPQATTVRPIGKMAYTPEPPPPAA